MKFYGGIWGGKRNERLDSVGDLDDHADCPIGNLAITQKLWADFDEIFRIALQWCNEQLIKFWRDLDHTDSPNWESRQYGVMKLPWPWQSALSECSCSCMYSVQQAKHPNKRLHYYTHTTGHQLGNIMILSRCSMDSITRWPPYTSLLGSHYTFRNSSGSRWYSDSNHTYMYPHR